MSKYTLSEYLQQIECSRSAIDQAEQMESEIDRLTRELAEAKARAVPSMSDVLDEYEARTKALPCQHEIPERGCSTYNWQMAAIRDLRALAARNGEGSEGAAQANGGAE